MWRDTRLRSSTVSSPSQPASSASSSGQSFRPVRATAKRAEAALDPLAHPVHEHVAVAEPDAERLGEILTLQALACRELEDELIACVESGRRLTHGAGQLLEVDGAETSRRRVIRSHDLSGRRRVERAHALATLRASIHLVAKDGEQPRLQLGRVAELAELLGSLDEHVLHDVGCLVPIVQHVRRRVVERIGVAVVDPGQSD